MRFVNYNLSEWEIKFGQQIVAINTAIILGLKKVVFWYKASKMQPTCGQ